MKTAIFASSFLNGTDWQGSNRVDRTRRYLDYYMKLQDQLEFTTMFLSDNGSDPANVRKLGIDTISGDDWKPLESPGTPGQILLWHREAYPRGLGLDYLCCWRALYVMRELIERFGYEKIIYIETDAYVVSRKLMKHTRELTSGWTCHKLKRYRFPAAEFNTLCADAFPGFLEFTSIPFYKHNGKLYESALSFTQVLNTFDCDRYGESLTQQRPEMDLYAQCPLTIPIQFNMEGKS